MVCPPWLKKWGGDMSPPVPHQIAPMYAHDTYQTYIYSHKYTQPTHHTHKPETCISSSLSVFCPLIVILKSRDKQHKINKRRFKILSLSLCLCPFLSVCLSVCLSVLSFFLSFFLSLSLSLSLSLPLFPSL